MNGVVIGLAGVWVLCQVFGGDALNRLGILSQDTGTQAPANISPDGIPNLNPKLPPLVDKNGFPY